MRVRTDGTEIQLTKKTKKKKGVLAGKTWYAFPLFDGERCNVGHYYR